jgi:hypothetical protein
MIFEFSSVHILTVDARPLAIRQKCPAEKDDRQGGCHLRRDIIRPIMIPRQQCSMTQRSDVPPILSIF